MRKNTYDQYIVKCIAYVVVTATALVALLPFISLVMSSFSSEKEIINNGYRLIPKDFSISAYKMIFLNPKYILSAYRVTILLTVIGTTMSLLLSTMGAYVLSCRDVIYRYQLAFFLYFTELFQGGLASYYITVSRTLHLKNTYLVLLLVPLFSVFNILILRNFIKGSIHQSLIESAKLDGANHFTIFTRIVLPLAKPALASIGLFITLQYWNDWWTAMMFVETKNKFPLQYLLYQILASVNISSHVADNVTGVELPKESLKLAMTVVSTGPIIFVYPFIQKYFVKGITIGAVKG